MKKSILNPQRAKPVSTTALGAIADRLFDPHLKRPRVITAPQRPALAASKLPPPCAEIDERPAWRVRRFRVWRDNAPSLYLAVLDPRRKVHLRRYQSYALPNVATYMRGVTAIPVELRPKPDPNLPTPIRPLIVPRTPYVNNPTARIPKWEKNARWQRLLQYKYALDQEHERRFRRGMSILMDDVVEFEWDNMHEYFQWDTNPWKDEIDEGTAIQLTQFFKDIRKKSTNIYRWLESCLVPILPVPRREEVHKAVKAETKRRDGKRERREARQAARDAKAAQEALPAVEAEVAATDHITPVQVPNLIPGAAEMESAIAIHGLPLAGELDELDQIRSAIQMNQTQCEVQADRQTDQDGLDSWHQVGVTLDDYDDPAKTDAELVDGQTIAAAPDGGDLTDASTISTKSVRTPVDRLRPPLLPSVAAPLTKPIEQEQQAGQSLTEKLRSISDFDHDDRAAEHFLQTLATSKANTTPDGIAFANPSLGKAPKDTGTKAHDGPGRQVYVIRKPQGLDEDALLEMLPQLYGQAKAGSQTKSNVKLDGKESTIKRPTPQSPLKRPERSDSGTSKSNRACPHTTGIKDAALLKLLPRLSDLASGMHDPMPGVSPSKTSAGSDDLRLARSNCKTPSTSRKSPKKAHIASEPSTASDSMQQVASVEFKRRDKNPRSGTSPSMSSTRALKHPTLAASPQPAAVSISPPSSLARSSMFDMLALPYDEMQSSDSTSVPRRMPSVYRYAELNQDNDTQALVPSSSPAASEVATNRSWSSGLLGETSDSASNDSYTSEDVSRWDFEQVAMGSGADTGVASEPDTLNTAGPGGGRRESLLSS